MPLAINAVDTSHLTMSEVQSPLYVYVFLSTPTSFVIAPIAAMAADSCSRDSLGRVPCLLQSYSFQ
eukprot:187770-Amphidinium_carterae.1